MHQRQLVRGLAAAFGAMTVVLAVGSVAGNLVLLPVAAIFAGLTYLFWMHASGRLMGRLYRSVEDRARTEERPQGGGFGAGPREEWTGPREGRTISQEARRRARQQAHQRARERTRQDARQRNARTRQSEPTAREAYERLGVDPGADEATVKEAYRERIKEVHPDSDGGDAEEFKRVQRAYDRLTE